VSFCGRIEAVKPRIGLHRSFDQVWHSYRGYVLLLEGGTRIAVGAAAHEKHRFRIGDVVEGQAAPLPDPRSEWADLYKVRRLCIRERGPVTEERPADPDGGIAPPLADYRARGHRRLDSRTHNRSCRRCPFGAVMATEIVLDQWNPARRRWRVETHCYGPRDCPRYRAGRARSVPGRKPGMVYLDDDVEREADEAR
jgi:hypothetical protein